MSVTSVRTNDEESVLFKSYANLHGISLSEAFKQALIEKIEDEFDIADMETAVKKFEKNPKTYSLEELRRKYDL